jgi:hypothetical protein
MRETTAAMEADVGRILRIGEAMIDERMIRMRRDGAKIPRVGEPSAMAV